MIVENLTQLGDPGLKTPTQTISDFHSREVGRTITDLIDTMRHHELIGLAAPQIGRNLRIFVTEVRATSYRNPDQNDRIRIYINPEIIQASDEMVEIYEGCGSVAYARLFGPVTRPESVKVSALDEMGKPFKLEASGLLARVIQHEQDHLDGLEFTDKLTDNSRLMSDGEYKRRVLKKT